MEDLFFRAISEKHQHLVERIDQIFKSIVGNDDERKSQSISAGWEATNSLASLLAAADQPKWLRRLLDVLSKSRKDLPLDQLLTQLIVLSDHARKHNWRTVADAQSAFDFDAIYEKHKAESQLPRLFDQVASSLQALIESGEIDSKKIAGTIEKLVSTIQKNKNASYFSVHGTWSFLTSVLQNFLLEELKKIPTLGSFITALEVSVAQLDSGIQNMQSNIATELKETQSGDFAFLTYNQRGVIVNSSNDSTGLNTSA